MIARLLYAPLALRPRRRGVAGRATEGKATEGKGAVGAGPVRRGLGRFRRDQRGVTALEFALLSPVIIAMMFSFYDVGIVMVRSSLLSQAVDKSMRDVRLTGKVPLDTFIANVCDRAMILTDCERQLVVDMVPVGNRAVNLPASSAPCKDPNISDMRPLMRYQPSVQGQILFVRVCATSAPLVPWGLGKVLVGDNPDGASRIVVTTAFMAE